MGFVYVHGPCIGCRTLISYNPAHVPSIRVNGIREPLCAGCFDRWNAIHRTGKGLPPLTIHPEAYEPLETFSGFLTAAVVDCLKS